MTVEKLREDKQVEESQNGNCDQSNMTEEPPNSNKRNKDCE